MSEWSIEEQIWGLVGVSVFLVIISPKRTIVTSEINSRLLFHLNHQFRVVIHLLNSSFRAVIPRWQQIQDEFEMLI